MSATALCESALPGRNLVAIENVVKTFGDKRALGGVTFAVSAGRICGLLGRNGSGKTTLFRLLMGILKATSGRLTIDGLGLTAEMALAQVAGLPVLPAVWRVEGGAMAGFPGLDELFEGHYFDREIIVLCVRWYLRFKLSFRDPVEMMAERGLSMAHTTIMRWVHHYVPEFERRWNRFARPVGPSWRVDETYV
jgi:ABC-type cobalamin/Fe3+-siderophores transport system ATPase subunit